MGAATRILNALRNRSGRLINHIAPPAVATSLVSGTNAVTLVCQRWDYGSRFNGPGYEYRRFLPALYRMGALSGVVPIERRHRIRRDVQRLFTANKRNVVFAVFQDLGQIPSDFFSLKDDGFELFNWYTDDDMLFESFSRHVALKFDCNVTTYEGALQKYTGLGARAVKSQWAASAVSPPNPRRPYLFCFVGRMYGRREQLVRRLKQEFGELGFVHDSRLRPISEAEMDQAYCNSIFALDEPHAFQGGAIQVKARVFEAAAYGCALLTPRNPQLELYYPKDDLFQYSNDDELFHFLRDARINPEKYCAAGERARVLTGMLHLYTNRFEAIFGR